MRVITYFVLVCICLFSLNGFHIKCDLEKLRAKLKFILIAINLLMVHTWTLRKFQFSSFFRNVMWLNNRQINVNYLFVLVFLWLKIFKKKIDFFHCSRFYTVFFVHSSFRINKKKSKKKTLLKNYLKKNLSNPFPYFRYKISGKDNERYFLHAQ